MAHWSRPGGAARLVANDPFLIGLTAAATRRRGPPSPPALPPRSRRLGMWLQYRGHDMDLIIKTFGVLRI